jgi:putative tricarboxylic transport membrane protein
MANNIFDVYVMMVSGIVGYFLSKLKVPSSPAILGLILGPMAEANFRTALLKTSGDVSVSFATPLCWFFIALIFFSIFGGSIGKLILRIVKKGRTEGAS